MLLLLVAANHPELLLSADYIYVALSELVAECVSLYAYILIDLQERLWRR